MANIKVKWPGQNIYEDETHRLVTDEQIARWDKILDAPIIGDIEPNMDFNDIYQPGFYRVAVDIFGEDSPNNAPTKNEYLVGGIVITKPIGHHAHAMSIPFAVIQIFYDIYLRKYMRVGVPLQTETNVSSDDAPYYGSNDTIEWGDWAVVQYSFDETYNLPAGIVSSPSTYYFMIPPS